jgi:hypothetical protein
LLLPLKEQLAMQIDIPGIAAIFDDLPLGGFFKVGRYAQMIFGLCVADDVAKSAIIFPPKSVFQKPVWFVPGGFPKETVISYPNAMLRAEPSSVSLHTQNVGDVISAGGTFFIRTHQERGNYRTFNLQTGARVAPSDESGAIYFARWQVGLVIDQKFDAIFTFPEQSAK